MSSWYLSWFWPLGLMSDSESESDDAASRDSYAFSMSSSNSSGDSFFVRDWSVFDSAI